MPGKMGRKPGVTPEITKAVATGVGIGLHFSTACVRAGISPDVGHAWMRRGRGQIPGRSADACYVHFVTEIEKAEADRQASSLGRIYKAAIGGDVVETKTVSKTDDNGHTTTTKIEKKTLPQWTADAWFLERKHPEKWGRKDPEAITMADILEFGRALADSARELFREIARGRLDVKVAELRYNQAVDEHAKKMHERRQK